MTFAERHLNVHSLTLMRRCIKLSVLARHSLYKLTEDKHLCLLIESCRVFIICFNMVVHRLSGGPICGQNIYSRLSLCRIPKDCLKHFEIFVPRHVRFAELRKTINRTNTFNKWICNVSLEVRYIENIVENRRNRSLGAISPLFHNILLPVVRSPC